MNWYSAEQLLALLFVLFFPPYTHYWQYFFLFSSIFTSYFIRLDHSLQQDGQEWREPYRRKTAGPSWKRAHDFFLSILDFWGKIEKFNWKFCGSLDFRKPGKYKECELIFWLGIFSVLILLVKKKWARFQERYAIWCFLESRSFIIFFINTRFSTKNGEIQLKILWFIGFQGNF